MSYDAILLVSFGGPEGPAEVMPFLERVTAGRGVPRDRLDEVAHHYLTLGGVSPVNAQSRALLAEMKNSFLRNNIELPLYWGNRNSDPYFDVRPYRSLAKWWQNTDQSFDCPNKEVTQYCF